ncbi:hypothetical protein DPMN_151741 [Dreissena polymorpha]|uniref:Uncharacterized protein n=1 Tax=Dreissena polymorpha TaxID=45954 RepID=A0A9D4FHQ4_DREPO|nr:hypothetical protein DPMN_151741 [Dreissena polymorpha]
MLVTVLIKLGSEYLFRYVIYRLLRYAVPDHQNECGIAGVWRDQLQSVMKFTCVGGHIDGTYFTAVGKADGFYELSGNT